MTIETGFCRLTATTQNWLDATESVISYKTFGGDDYALFRYDTNVEIGVSPIGVFFADDDWDDAAIPAIEGAIIAAICESDAEPEERELLNAWDWAGIEGDIIAAGHARTFVKQELNRIRDAR